MTTRYFAPAKPRLFAHRGASGHLPENTLPAFQEAVAKGLTYLELDLRATRDGAIVIHHDETTGRLCGRDLPVADCTLAELQALDAGATFSPDGGHSFPVRGQGIGIPTLAELFQACPGALFNMEIKQEQPPMEELVLTEIDRLGMAKAVLLAAEKADIMTRLRSRCGQIPTSLSFDETAEFFSWLQGGCQQPYSPPGVALQIPVQWGELTLVTAQSLQAAHSVGLEMHVWTVNTPAQIEGLLALGVDGIMSDFPERLLAAVGQQK